MFGRKRRKQRREKEPGMRDKRSECCLSDAYSDLVDIQNFLAFVTPVEFDRIIKRAAAEGYDITLGRICMLASLEALEEQMIMQ